MIAEKDEETKIWSWRKAAWVFGTNHKDRRTVAKYQNRQPCCGTIVKIGNITLSKPWWGSGSGVSKELRISLKELRETQRWLKLIQKVSLIKKPELLNDILEETEELIKIFFASIKTAEKKKK